MWRKRKIYGGHEEGSKRDEVYAMSMKDPGGISTCRMGRRHGGKHEREPRGRGGYQRVGRYNNESGTDPARSGTAMYMQMGVAVDSGWGGWRGLYTWEPQVAHESRTAARIWGDPAGAERVSTAARS